MPPMINTNCVTEITAGGADFAAAGTRLADAS